MPTGLCVPKHMSWMWGSLVFVVLSAVAGVVLGWPGCSPHSCVLTRPRGSPGSLPQASPCLCCDPTPEIPGTALHELLLPARGPQEGAHGAQGTRVTSQMNTPWAMPSLQQCPAWGHVPQALPWSAGPSAGEIVHPGRKCWEGRWMIIRLLLRE